MITFETKKNHSRSNVECRAHTSLEPKFLMIVNTMI